MSVTWLDAACSRGNGRQRRETLQCVRAGDAVDQRGKVPQPVEFGHRVLVIEDGAGFVCHYAILPRGAEDREVLVEEMKQVAAAAARSDPQCVVRSRLSFSRESARVWPKLVAQPCLPKPGHIQAERQEQEATVEFRRARRRHPGIESAIGALQSGQRAGSVPGSDLRRVLPVRGAGDPGSKSSCVGQAADRARGPEV